MMAPHQTAVAELLRELLFRGRLRIRMYGPEITIPSDSTFYINTIAGCKSPFSSRVAIARRCPSPSRTLTFAAAKFVATGAELTPRPDVEAKSPRLSVLP